MVGWTTTQWIQLIAALTLPLGLIVVTLGRMAKGKRLLKKIRWNDMMMAIMWMIIPALIIFALQGILSSYAVLGGIVLVIVISLLKGGQGTD